MSRVVIKIKVVVIFLTPHNFNTNCISFLVRTHFIRTSYRQL